MFESSREINSLKKSLKTKEKDVYNYNSKVVNLQETIANLKAETSELRHSNLKLEKGAKIYEKKIKMLETKKVQHYASTQTSSVVDIPYRVTDPLPPIFGSKFCHQTKRIFLSKSLPDLNSVCWVSTTEDDMLRDKADEALDYLYDMEVVTFYEIAKREAAEERSRRNFSGTDCKLDVG